MWRCDVETGAEVWIWEGEVNIPATVVHVFEKGSFGYQFKHYVLEIRTTVDDFLTMRPDWLVFAMKGQRLP